MDNPRGYYEWEAIKHISKTPELLDDEAVNCKVLKCVSMLLPRMPAKHDYKVIFMLRPISQVVASQRSMTTRLGTKSVDLDSEQLERGLRGHREEIRRWAVAAPHVELLEVSYPSLVRDPVPIISKLVAFLGGESLPNEQAITAVIDLALHRQRG
jgi:hypothetical protein